MWITLSDNNLENDFYFGSLGLSVQVEEKFNSHSFLTFQLSPGRALGMNNPSNIWENGPCPGNWEKGGYKCYKLTLFYCYEENIAMI